MLTTTFNDLLDGDVCIVLDNHLHGVYAVFEKSVPVIIKCEGKQHILNAKNLPDDCFCQIPGDATVVRVSISSYHNPLQYDFDKEHPKMEIDYGDFGDDLWNNCNEKE